MLPHDLLLILLIRILSERIPKHHGDRASAFLEVLRRDSDASAIYGKLYFLPFRTLVLYLLKTHLGALRSLYRIDFIVYLHIFKYRAFALVER